MINWLFYLIWAILGVKKRPKNMTHVDPIILYTSKSCNIEFKKTNFVWILRKPFVRIDTKLTLDLILAQFGVKGARKYGPYALL